MESLQPEIGPPGGESLSAFLDGELSEVDCAELIETVRVHPGVGRALSRYSLIRLVIFLRPIVVSNPTLESDELRQFQRLLPSAQSAPTLPASARSAQ